MTMLMTCICWSSWRELSSCSQVKGAEPGFTVDECHESPAGLSTVRHPSLTSLCTDFVTLIVCYGSARIILVVLAFFSMHYGSVLSLNTDSFLVPSLSLNGLSALTAPTTRTTPHRVLQCKTTCGALQHCFLSGVALMIPLPSGLQNFWKKRACGKTPLAQDCIFEKFCIVPVY